MKRIFTTLLVVMTITTASGQVIISLLLGDKLNSGKVEFGLDGGMNFTGLTGIEGSRARGFFLGFYFDIKIKEESPWLFNTGVIVKSPLGEESIAPYSLNNPDLDNIFQDGEVQRQLRYFDMPFCMKYVFKNKFFADAGIQIGLLNKATDVFVHDVENSEDLTFKHSVKDLYHPLDIGLRGGFGYRLMKGNGMNLGVHYYMGLSDITIDDTTPDVKNSALYFSLGIPIGAGKANEAAN